MKLQLSLMLSALMIVSSFATASAQDDKGLSANQRVVGHTVSDDTEISGAAFGEAGTYTIGAMLPASLLEYYAGCRIVGIRAAASIDLGRTRFFVDNILTSGIDEVISQKQRFYEGWNNIFFNGEGIEITGEDTLFFGYDYVETPEMVAADLGGICSTGAETEGGFVLYMNNSFYPITNVGKLCVQLIVDVSNLPADNMTLTYLDTGFKYKKVGEEIELFAMVQNVGRETASSYQMAVEFDDREPQYFDVSSPILSGGSDSWQAIPAVPSGLGIGSHQVRAYICGINGHQYNGRPRAIEANFALYDNSLPRDRVYMEVYSNCRTGYQQLFDETLDMLKKDCGNDFCLVKVAAADNGLAVDDSSRLHALYAYTSPSFSVNRAYFPGESHIAYDLNDFFGLLPTEFLVGILEGIVMQDGASPSFATIALKGDYDADSRNLSVTASGDILEEARAIYGDVALTLMVVEDGVKSWQWTVDGRRDNNYLHDDMLRCYLTAPEGDKIDISADNYSYSCMTTLPVDINAEKMRVVGFLTKEGADGVAAHAADFDVINATQIEFADMSAVDEFETDSSLEIEGYYSLEGIRLEEPASGISIVRFRNGSARKIVR